MAKQAELVTAFFECTPAFPLSHAWVVRDLTPVPSPEGEGDSLFHQLVILGMCPDPKPYDAIWFFHAEGAVFYANTH